MRPTGIEVADIFRQIGPAYRQEHADSLSHGQRRVMTDIERCRTAALGGHVEQCDACGHQRIAFNSCRNRHCPKCQSLVRAQWLQDRQAELLPVEYFHVVFTVPQAIAAIAYQNKAVVYDILFRATAETLRTIAADPKHQGADIGFIAVLHTWGQTLMHHPMPAKVIVANHHACCATSAPCRRAGFWAAPSFLPATSLKAFTVSARPASALARNQGLSDDLLVLSCVGCNARCK